MLEKVRSLAVGAGIDHRRASRRSAIVLLAAVLALNQADAGSVGALGPTFERIFQISHFQLGMLAGAFSIVGAIASVPVGVLTDKARRITLLFVSVLLWSVAMFAGGFAISFLMLLITRMFLGLVSATGGPTISSLTGDLFPRAERARALSLIQTGEYIGIGAGFLITGAIVSTFSWRWLYWLLALVGVVLALALSRYPEPPRGGNEVQSESGTAPEHDVVAEKVEAGHIKPDPNAIVQEDPDEMSLPVAMREVLEVKTNVIVIVASTIGYFFFAGLRIFAVLFATEQYGVSNATAALLLPVVGVGAVAGLLLGGRIADRLTERGVLAGRVYVAIAGFVFATVAFLPALFTHSLAVALPLLTIGAAGLAAPNPPLDAVRLDVIVPKLWGRAESVRALSRTGAEAIGPIVFGLLADHLGGGGPRGVQLTLLIALPALLANGLVLFFAARTYPHDVASALASVRSEAQADSA